MATIKLQGNSSGSGTVVLTAPNTNSTRTITLPDQDVNLGNLGGPIGSSLLTISSDTQVHTWSHGLGYTPLSFGAYLQCITTYGTFTVGDRMMVHTTMDDDGTSQTIWASSTQVGVSFRSMGYTTQPRNNTGQYIRDIRTYFKVGLWAMP